jgi:hypothetical protein
VPVLDVDDAETAHPKSEIAVDKETILIWPSMDQPFALKGKYVPANGSAHSSVPAGNSAHGSLTKSERNLSAPGNQMRPELGVGKKRVERLQKFNVQDMCFAVSPLYGLLRT